MGRPKPENSIRHFSHRHPLFPSSLNHQDQSSSPSSRCVVCKLKLLNLPSYTCKPCNFHIHLKCFQLPQKIKHPFDENHLLSLISSPKYQQGRFRCDACGKPGDGFSYHCEDCEIDLHTICANLPSQVTHQSHPHHQLSLTFSTLAGVSAIPGSFYCNVCLGHGYNSWLYSCNECGGFDAHLLCATRKLATPPNLVQHGLNQAQPQFNGTISVNNNNPNPFGPTRPIIRLTNSLLRMGRGGPYDASGSSSSSGFIEFDPSVFESVDPSVFYGFDPSVVGSIDPSVFPGFDPSVYGSVDPSVFAGYDPSVFAGFDPSVFGSVDLSAFTGFDPSSVFESFDPSSVMDGFDPSSLFDSFSGFDFF